MEEAQSSTTSADRPTARRARGVWRRVLLLLCPFLVGCTTIRVTDPPRTATEQFLMSQAVGKALDALTVEALRDRAVWVDTGFLTGSAVVPPEVLFTLAQMREELLMGGVRLVHKRELAQVVLEVRSAGIGIDRHDFLLGLPAIYIPGVQSATGNIPVATPELAIIKRLTQRGFASVAYVAYWADTGEVVAQSGPGVGRTMREDWWFFGIGPRTVGDIVPTEPVQK
ncbi:MAG: DUF6655 family protein [Tepidisphaeraceae bacterium]